MGEIKLDSIECVETKYTEMKSRLIFPRVDKTARKEGEDKRGGSLALLVEEILKFEELLVNDNPFRQYIIGKVTAKTKYLIVLIV